MNPEERYTTMKCGDAFRAGSGNLWQQGGSFGEALLFVSVQV
jgi:hypothetical protein